MNLCNAPVLFSGKPTSLRRPGQGFSETPAAANAKSTVPPRSLCRSQTFAGSSKDLVLQRRRASCDVQSSFDNDTEAEASEDLSRAEWLPLATDAVREYCSCALCKAEEKAEAVRLAQEQHHEEERRHGRHSETFKTIKWHGPIQLGAGATFHAGCGGRGRAVRTPACPPDRSP